MTQLPSALRLAGPALPSYHPFSFWVKSLAYQPEGLLGWQVLRPVGFSDTPGQPASDIVTLLGIQSHNLFSPSRHPGNLGGGYCLIKKIIMVLNRIVFLRYKYFKYVTRYIVKNYPFLYPRNPVPVHPSKVNVAIVHCLVFQSFFMPM